MSETSTSYQEFMRDGARRSGVALIDQPDMRIAKFSFFIPLIVLTVGIIIYLLPIAEETKYLGLISFTGVFGVAAIGIPLGMYAALAKTVYTVSNEFIEYEGGFILHRSFRRIPLTYIRDVTYGQSFIQALFGLSTITVSATNGDKIRLEHVRDGKEKRELIWNLVLSKSPGAHCEPEILATLSSGPTPTEKVTHRETEDRNAAVSPAPL